MKPAIILALALLSGTPFAQDIAEGNGYGDAYIQVGPAYLGGFFKHDIGSPSAPNSFAVFSYSDGFDTSVHPILGPVALDIFSPIYGIIILPTGPTGNLHFELFLPAIPEWVGLPPFYSNVVTFEGGQWSSSKTVPLWFENENSWTPVSVMGTPRMYHTATQLGADGKDNRIKVFVAGGGGGTVTIPTATNTTEIFDPLSRTFTPGPVMSVERATHTATRLTDGRVLLAGGLDSIGVCTATCEIYDRTTDTLAPTGNMSAPRAGHTATLLDDGRVLVTGGFADYQNPATAFAAALNTAQTTAEIFDPATGAWTPVAQPMSAKRAAHAAVKLLDGKVMVISGVTGGSGAYPSFTPKVDLFDPATETFTPLPDILLEGFVRGRAFHGASVLGNGDVLVTGGLYTGGSNGDAISTKDCQRWNGSSWSMQAALPVAVAWHDQLTLPNGKALISGGLEVQASSLVGGPNPVLPKAFTGVHDGTTVAPLIGIGLNPGIPGSSPDLRGAMSLTRLHDGSLLFLGGTNGTGTVYASGYVYTPKP
jgi:hypothetical protein